ncbi:MAG TPA: energy transducer TonB [Gammaproteobacteria bacterium]|nr:energy transducer TonB [Gammaproteobacteria bacterium]
MRSIKHPVTFESIVMLLVAAVLAPVAASAQIMPPTPLETPQPEPPTNRFSMPMEGFAIVRYSVLADGSVANVSTIDQMPATLSERNVRATVESWTFEPATRDGTAVDWHNNEAVMIFDVETIPAEPSPMFVRGYRQVEDLLAEGEQEDALDRSDRLLGMEASRLAEMGVGFVQNARVNMMLGNLHEAYAAIERATNPDLSLLDPSELVVALEYRNTLELRLGDVVGALETFARRQELGTVPESDLMASNLATIEAALGGDAAIGVQGKILDEAWSHELTRRTFAVGDVDGTLRQVDIKCDMGTAEFEFSDESEWSLPESWGECTVTVLGRRDAEFVLYEFQ